jgi:hypothetical protein
MSKSPLEQVQVDVTQLNSDAVGGHGWVVCLIDVYPRYVAACQGIGNVAAGASNGSALSLDIDGTVKLGAELSAVEIEKGLGAAPNDAGVVVGANAPKGDGGALPEVENENRFDAGDAVADGVPKGDEPTPNTSSAGPGANADLVFVGVRNVPNGFEELEVCLTGERIPNSDVDAVPRGGSSEAGDEFSRLQPVNSPESLPIIA